MAARLKSLGLWAFLALSVAGIAQLVLSALDVRLDAPAARALTLLYGVWTAVAFVLLQVELGRRLFARWLDADLENALARWLLAFSAGFFATVAALLALAVVRPLDAPAVSLYVAVALVAIAPRVASRRAALGRALRPPCDRDLARALALAAVGALALAPYLVQTLLPSSDWDGASTHLPLASRLATHGLQTLPPDLDHLAIPAGVHLVYAAFQAVGAEAGVIPLNWIVSLLVCAAAAALAAPWGRSAGWFAAAICASTNLVLELGLDPRVDGFLALFGATATLGVLIWLPRAGPRGALLLAALALGDALATKETGLVVLGLLGPPVLLGVARAEPGARRARLRAALLALLFAVVPAGSWYVAKAVRFGDPVYPWWRGPSLIAADGHRRPPREAAAPVLARVRDTLEFERVLAQMQRRIDAETTPRTLLDPWSVLTRPEDHARKPGHFASPLLLFFVALPLVRRDARALALTWVGGALFLVAAARSPLLRYALPAVPLLAAGAGVVAGSLRALPWRIAWIAALVVIGAWNLRFEWQKLPVLRPRAWLSGAASEATWLAEVGYNLTPVLPRVAVRIDRMLARGELDPDGRILLVGESKIDRLPLDAVPDISRNGGPWLARLVRAGGDLDAVHRVLWEEGIRYVLYNRGHYEWVMAHVEAKGDLLALSLVTLERFLHEHARRLLQEGGISLFAIEPPDRATGPPA